MLKPGQEVCPAEFACQEVHPGGFGGARNVEPMGEAAEKALSSIIESLEAAAQRAANILGFGSGPVYGTRVHTEFEAQVKALDLNLLTERSYLNGDPVTRGTPGSVRLDVIEGPLQSPTAVYDLKTGSATLTPSRVEQIQSNLPNGNNVPVYQVRP